jgi:NTP pyrophosphatase (non-canonical NTP hydrolase)
MELKDYQEKAMTTCMESSRNYSYMAGNLSAEVGELQGKVNKAQRKEQLVFNEKGHIVWEGDIEDEITFNEELKKEAGDVLWQLSGLCSVMGWSLEDVAQMNLDKLAARKKAGTIVGNGDGIIREK